MEEDSVFCQEKGLSSYPDSSIDLDHVKDAAMNSQLDFTDESGVINLMANRHSLSPFRTRTMKEYDQQISELKKENFNLKLRIYFLEEKMHQKFTTYDRDEAINKMNIELKVELESAKKELADKQELVLKAHQALEVLESERKTLIERLSSRKDIEHQRDKDSDCTLESLKDKSKKTDVEFSRPSSVVTEFVKEKDRKDYKIAELQSALEDNNYKIDAFQRKIKALESTIQAKDNYIKLQEQNQVKKSKAIQGLLKAIQAKNKECNELSKKLEYQSLPSRLHDDLHVTRRGAMSPEIQQVDSCTSTKIKQTTTHTDMQENCEIEDQTESHTEGSLQKEESIGRLEDFQHDLKQTLEKKDEEIEQLQITHTHELAEKCRELQNIEIQLRDAQQQNTALESRLDDCRKECIGIEKLLIECKEEGSNIKVKFEKSIDSVNMLSEYIDKMSHNGFHFSNMNIEDEAVAALGKKLVKLYEFMKEMRTNNSAVKGNIDNVDLIRDSVLSKLDSGDLICIDHEKISALSLSSSVDDTEKNGNTLHYKLFACLKEKLFMEEQLIRTLWDIRLLRLLADGKIDKELCVADSGDDMYKCCQKMGIAQLADEIKDELSMLKTQVGMLKFLHVSELVNKDTEHNQLKQCTMNEDDRSGPLIEDVKEATEVAVSSSSHFSNCLPITHEEIKNSKEELSRLRSLLTSTEGTVHMLGSKVKHYRQMLINSGAWPAIYDDHQSPYDFGVRQKAQQVPITLCSTLQRSDFPLKQCEFRLSGASTVDYFSSMDNLVKSDFAINYSLLGPPEVNRHCQSKCASCLDNTCNHEIRVDNDTAPTITKITDLQNSQLSSNALPVSSPLKIVEDVSCQTSLHGNFNTSFRELASENAAVMSNFIKSKCMSTALIKHLEEVKKFLTELLHFDINGVLRSSYVTSESVSSVNTHLKTTWDLSNSLSLCLSELDKSLNICPTSPHFDEQNENLLNSCTRLSLLDDSVTIRNDSLNFPFSNNRSHNKELDLDNDVSLQRQTMNDNFILVLKPKVSSGVMLNYDEELPTCSLTFDHQGSFLTSTNVNNYIDETKVGKTGDRSSSDSDTWSGPDIGVSQQRIGLESSQLLSSQSNKRSWLSPRKRDSGTTNSTSSSLSDVSAKVSMKSRHVQENNVIEQQNLMLLDIQKEKEFLLSQVQELTEKFESYQETIESLQLMVEEHQKSSKNAVLQAEMLKSELLDKEEKLKESEVIKEQLHEAFNDIKKEFEENVSNLKQLQEVNSELRTTFDKYKEDVIKKEQEKNLHVDSELERLRSENKTLHYQLQDSITLNKALMQKSKQSDDEHESAAVLMGRDKLHSSLTDSCESTSSSTLCHRQYISANRVLDCNTDVYHESGVPDPEAVLHHAELDDAINSPSQSSPDLGIESDRSHVSSLERKSQTSCVDDLTSLKRSIVESLTVLRAVRRIAKEHLISLKRNRIILTDNKMYVDWKDVYSGCCSIKNYLLEACSLTDQMWRTPTQFKIERLPHTKYSNTLLTDNKHLLLLQEEELLQLYHKLAAEKQKADDALAKLEHANQLKRGMEKAIVKQLRRTHTVLIKAKGNLEHQQMKCVTSCHKESNACVISDGLHR